MKLIKIMLVCLFAIIALIICNSSEVKAERHKDITVKRANLGTVKLSSSSQVNTHTDIFLNYSIEQRKAVYTELKKHKAEPCFELSWEMTELLFRKALLEILKETKELADIDEHHALSQVKKLNGEKESINVFANSKDGACRGKLELKWDIEKMSFITDMTVKCECSKAPLKGGTCTKDNYPSVYKYVHGGIIKLKAGRIVGRVFGTKIVETKALMHESSLDCCKMPSRQPEDTLPDPKEPEAGQGRKKLFGTEVKNCQDCFNLKVKIHRLNKDINSKQRDISALKDFNKTAETTIKNNNIKLDILKKGKVVYIYENKYNGKLMTSQGRPLQDYQTPPNFVLKGTGEFPHTPEGKRIEKNIKNLEKENKTLEAKIKANKAMIEILEDLTEDLKTELDRLNKLLKECLALCISEDKVSVSIPEPEPKKEDDLVKTCRCKSIQYAIRDLKKFNKLYKKENNKNDLPGYQKAMEQLKSDYSACNTLCSPAKQPKIGLSINFGFLLGGRGNNHRPSYTPPVRGCH